MSTFEVRGLDRDPKTGHLLPGHKVSSKESKVIAQRMAELKAMYLSCVTEDDMKMVFQRHMDCIRQDKDVKAAIAAIALFYDRFCGKQDHNINVTAESRSLTASISLSAEEQQVMEAVIARSRDALPPAQ